MAAHLVRITGGSARTFGEEFVAEKYSRLAARESDYASIKLIKASVCNFSDLEITSKTIAMLIASF